MTERELINICEKYKIIPMDKIRLCTREVVVDQIQKWSHAKQQQYRQEGRVSQMGGQQQKPQPQQQQLVVRSRYEIDQQMLSVLFHTETLDIKKMLIRLYLL